MSAALESWPPADDGHEVTWDEAVVQLVTQLGARPISALPPDPNDTTPEGKRRRAIYEAATAAGKAAQLTHPISPEIARDVVNVIFKDES